VLLKQALDSTDPDSDPEGYEKARIAYYTLLNGPGWLAQEKQTIAKNDVEPVIKSYRQRHSALKGEQQSQSIFTNLANALEAQEGADKQSNQFLQKQLTAEKDKAHVADRINQLGGNVSIVTTSYLSWIVDIVLAILGIYVAYKLYTRFFGKITMSPPVDLTST
jgi:hypothetical protein